MFFCHAPPPGTEMFSHNLPIPVELCYLSKNYQPLTGGRGAVLGACLSHPPAAHYLRNTLLAWGQSEFLQSEATCLRGKFSEWLILKQESAQQIYFPSYCPIRCIFRPQVRGGGEFTVAWKQESQGSQCAGCLKIPGPIWLTNCE